MEARSSVRSLFLLLLAVGLLAIVLGLLEPPARTLFWGSVFDLGHVPLFGAVALLLRGALTDAARNGARASVRAFLLTLALAAGAEAVQLIQPNRSPSVNDFLRGAAGAGAALLLWAAARDAMTARVRRLAAASAAVLLLTSSVQLVVVVAAYAARTRAFPVLFRLDGGWWERSFLKLGEAELTPNPPGPIPAGVQAHARLDLHPALYSGVMLDEPYPDWTGFERLVFTVASQLESPVTLNVRIHDAWHVNRFDDRFNAQYSIRPGANRIEILLDDVREAPVNREMDMRRIRGIILFVYQLRSPSRLYLSDFRLQ
jgi:hypothetical protein